MPPSERSAHPEAASAVANSDRLQPYRFIHKALRALMFRTLQQVASLDAARVDERAEMQVAVEELLQVCVDHATHENRFFHAPVRERAPHAVLAFDGDHHEHFRTIAALREQLARLVEGGASARRHAYALYLDLSRFIGESLEHMAEEETQLTLALWQNFSDPEIQAMGDALRATHGAQESAYYLRWLARSLDDAELADMISAARNGMPAQAFAGYAEAILGELPTPRRARLATLLGVSPVPGLVDA
jgi:hypothetical protein